MDIILFALFFVIEYHFPLTRVHEIQYLYVYQVLSLQYVVVIYFTFHAFVLCVLKTEVYDTLCEAMQQIY